MIVQAAEELSNQKPDAHKLRVRIPRRGDAGPVLRADGAELGGVVVPLPLDEDGRAELRRLELAAASASWPPGRFVRLELVDGAGAALGSRALPGSAFSGRPAPSATTERPPWGPAGPGRWAEPSPAPAHPFPPSWPAELMAAPPGLTAPGDRPAEPSALALALGFATATQNQNGVLVGHIVRLSEVAIQTGARVAVEAGAQHAQSARAAAAQLGALSGQVASVAERASERAELEAERAAAAVEAAAAADKAGALAELAAKLGTGGEEGVPGGAALIQAGMAFLASGARPVLHGRPAAPGQPPPAAAAPAAQLEDAAPPAAPRWSDRLLEALLEAQHDPSAGEQLAALGAALPAPVRAAIAGGVG